jgi:hypothetical protein
MAMAPIDSCGPIGPFEREGILTVLGRSGVTNQLNHVDALEAAPAAADGAAPSPPRRSRIPATWSFTPEAHQSRESASYRLGPVATRGGVSALATVQMPGTGLQGGTATFGIDIGLSLARPISLVGAATLLRDGLFARRDLAALRGVRHSAS